MTDLLNCPFCGSKANKYALYGEERASVICSNSSCQVRPEAKGGNYENNAKRWNRRATTEREKALVDALEFYANFPYERGLVYVKKEDSGRDIDFNDPNSTFAPFKYSYDKGDIAKQVLSQHKER